MIVNLLNSGQSAKQVSSDYSLSDNMIRRWRREALSEKESFTGRGKESLTLEEKRIKTLEAELKELKIERDILKKAARYFAKESG